MSVDLSKVWKRLDEEKLAKPLEGSLAPPKKSKHPINKLKEAYLIKTLFGVSFLALFIALFFAFSETVVRAGVAILIVAYIYFFISSYLIYRQIRVDLSQEPDLKSALKHTYDFVSYNVKLELRVALYIYPFAAAAGGLMGLASGGDDVYELISKWQVQVAMSIAIAIITPGGYLLARWMTKISYDKYLAELRALIDQLENPA